MVAIMALLLGSCRSQQSATNLYDMEGVSAVYLNEGLMNVGPLGSVGKFIEKGGKSKITSAEVITSSKRGAIKKAMPLIMDKIEAMKARPLALYTAPAVRRCRFMASPPMAIRLNIHSLWCSPPPRIISTLLRSTARLTVA